MFHPIVGYSVKGFIWYQGEGNVENYDDYATRLHHMILRWRQEFGQGNLPFLAVEIAPCSIYKGRASGRASRLREAQWTVFHNTPNTGMICTNDLVRPDEQLQVHPSKKYEVGLRLSNLALNKVYKKLKTPVDYPEFRKMEVQGSKAILSFTNCKKGFSKNDNIVGFEICGENNVYVPAQTIIKGNLVEVFSNKVEHPQKVRYAFQDFMLGNLKNKEGLPVVPFRSAF
jgi:sialate O-acetylesterase